MRSDIAMPGETAPEGPGPHALNVPKRIRLQAKRIFRLGPGALRKRHSALWGCDFFGPALILHLVFQSHLNTICGVPVGSALNLLWLGPKMIIFGMAPARALWISGTARN